MSRFTHYAPFALAAGFAFFGVQKFGAENLIFEILAERSGIALFEPYLRVFTGLAELVVAALFVVPRTRLLAGLGGLGIVAGAIAFHLSPWLGVVVPGIGIGLFLTALVLFALTATFTALEVRAQAAPRTEGPSIEGVPA